MPSWNAPMLEAPSPKKLTATRSRPRSRNAMALPVAIGMLAPTMALETMAPTEKSARCIWPALAADAAGRLAPDLGGDRVERRALGDQVPDRPVGAEDDVVARAAPSRRRPRPPPGPGTGAACRAPDPAGRGDRGAPRSGGSATIVREGVDELVGETDVLDGRCAGSPSTRRDRRLVLPSQRTCATATRAVRASGGDAGVGTLVLVERLVDASVATIASPGAARRPAAARDAGADAVAEGLDLDRRLVGLDDEQRCRRPRPIWPSATSHSTIVTSPPVAPRWGMTIGCCHMRSGLAGAAEQHA